MALPSLEFELEALEPSELELELEALEVELEVFGFTRIRTRVA